MKLISDNLFESNSSRCVPKKDCNLERNFELCGMMMAHLILQGGTGFLACALQYSAIFCMVIR